MFGHEREIPRPQSNIFDLNLSKGEVYAFFLSKRLKDIPAESVTSVLDLYCGIGTLTIGSIVAFPRAQIHAVDFHKVLVPDALHHPRVTFHQGRVTDILSKGVIPKSDIVLMSYASRHHGFTEQNISLLADHVGGILFTVGDNDYIENEPWFCRYFNCKTSFPDDYAAIWEAV